MATKKTKKHEKTKMKKIIPASDPKQCRGMGTQHKQKIATRQQEMLVGGFVGAATGNCRGRGHDNSLWGISFEKLMRRHQRGWQRSSKAGLGQGEWLKIYNEHARKTSRHAAHMQGNFKI